MEDKKIGMQKKNTAALCTIGTAIGICAGIGIVLGTIMGNFIFWMLGGAAVGVVLGSIVDAGRKTK